MSFCMEAYWTCCTLLQQLFPPNSAPSFEYVTMIKLWISISVLKGFDRLCVLLFLCLTNYVLVLHIVSFRVLALTMSCCMRWVNFRTHKQLSGPMAPSPYAFRYIGHQEEMLLPKNRECTYWQCKVSLSNLHGLSFTATQESQVWVIGQLLIWFWLFAMILCLVDN